MYISFLSQAESSPKLRELSHFARMTSDCAPIRKDGELHELLVVLLMWEREREASDIKRRDSTTVQKTKKNLWVTCMKWYACTTPPNNTLDKKNLEGTT